MTTPTENPFNKRPPGLDWSRQDIEQRFGFPGGRFTAVNPFFSLILGILASVVFFALLTTWIRQIPEARGFCDMFLERGIIPYAIVLLFAWALAMLLLKFLKTGYQRRALGFQPVPVDPDFILNRETARDALLDLRDKVDDTRHFVLFNRVDHALSNLHNIGRVSDVSDILSTQAEYDEDQLASSYGLLNGFLWAIPVLGFIGTVLGLSQAISAFGDTLRSSADLSALKSSLQDVTAGLSIAFETTLVALVCALILQLILSWVQGRETKFLDDCNDYCHAHIVSRLKLKD
jgi:biopolymer transport protein ExbB/TolQ